MKRRFALLLPLAVAACQDAAPLLSPDPAHHNAALAEGDPGVIPGRFIVTLREGTSAAAVAREHGVTPDYVYRHVFDGFAGPMSAAARDGLLRDARVVRVEPDGIARTTTTQSNATWGLDRIDQRALPLSGTFTYTATGTGVKAYIIDTGILTTHAEFNEGGVGRAVHLIDTVDQDADATDCNGHGTHVAGTVGGETYGVAKGVTLVAVRVLNCDGSGTWSGVIAGMDEVTAHHKAGEPAVANLSLGGGANSSVDAAVDRMIDDGISVAVAAGNGNTGGVAQDACKYSPARVPRAITIGATDNTDTKTSWSNYGKCVDWFAPGRSITSAWHTGGINTISGTSMATPHVAGVAALYLDQWPDTSPPATPQQVRDALYALTTQGIVKSSKTTNNHLLFTSY